MRSLALCLITFFSLPAFALLPYEKTGNLYISMWSSDEVAIFTPSGEEVERFSHANLDGPRGIAFNPANGEIWIAAEHADAVLIFDHEHNYLRSIEHPDFNEPVGVTFASKDGIALEEQEVHISNSDGNTVMVFSQAGDYLREFSEMDLRDPNCSAFMGDGSFYVTNRLGNSLDKFGAGEAFEYRRSPAGMSSTMAVALDPNAEGFDDDTVWVSSGAGDRALYEYDQSGNLLQTIKPADINGGVSITPQGIAFDSEGNFFVVSYGNRVFQFNGEGSYLSDFSTGSGTSRSLALKPCEPSITTSCIALGTLASGGSSASSVSSVSTSSEASESSVSSAASTSSEISTSNDSMASSENMGPSSSAGAITLGAGPGSALWLVVFIGVLLLRLRKRASKVCESINADDNGR